MDTRESPIDGYWYQCQQILYHSTGKQKDCNHNRSIIRLNQTSYYLNKATEVCIDAKVTHHPIRNDTKQQNAKSTTDTKIEIKVAQK